MAASMTERKAAIEKNMAEAAKRAARDGDAPCLLAISKTQPPEMIVPLLDMGHRHFGENRVQEAAQKWPALKADYADVELHLVGPLQTNKAQEAVGLFDVIQTLDREKLARKLAGLKDTAGFPRLFIQVNTGAEPQKSGVLPTELAAFYGLCTGALGLAIDGLMCLPPVDAAAGPHFALLEKLSVGLVADAPDAPPLALSMGMSGDYETAIALGATHIRLGTALFGPRKTP